MSARATHFESFMQEKKGETMAKKRATSFSEYDDYELDPEKVVDVPAGGLTKEVLARAKEKALAVDAKRAKVPVSIRWDPALIDDIRILADDEGIPYQTLMKSLLKAGFKQRLLQINGDRKSETSASRRGRTASRSNSAKPVSRAPRSLKRGIG